ncbi:hypothetical protein QVD17_39032 [Tagetes erecta]|uniref:R13L1/DRL21-like LRR repeat region domain-containing protein n=1 Tax=Tagetes erecta TaxID=13708 RepID=A0AAD8NGQ4_TARER|nr:hypothetical protein QVD17_39032 [Tagetes erecta]
MDDKMDANKSHEALEKVHHLSFIREEYIKEYTVDKKFKALERARRLRTFLPLPVTRLPGILYISKSDLRELPQQLPFLRVLSLAFHKIDFIPESIGSLKHLRYLNFSKTNIILLPEEIGNLHNLQILLLSGCRYLYRLPDSIYKLTNLRHLDIVNTNDLYKMPSGICGLTSLQTLSRVIIGKESECRVSDLKSLVHLRGQLSIEGLQRVKDVVHVKEANLHQKKGIYDLQMKWSAIFDDSRNGTTEYEVLEGLRPFKKLGRLEIKFYGGTKFPSWVGDPTFDCLKELILYGCRSCTCLPTLGQLRSLQTLTVTSMCSLKRLGF